ncbi:MAG: hypothetical protein DDT19_01717 [Syntrophomonadaceae bacterium]|nr:hypothetical protein [Bacillota bacterium]
MDKWEELKEAFEKGLIKRECNCGSPACVFLYETDQWGRKRVYAYVCYTCYSRA